MSSIRGCDRAIATYSATRETVVAHRPERTSAGAVPGFLTSSTVQRFLRAVLLTTLLALIGLPSSAVDVVADDLADAYEISGAVLLNASTPEAQGAATCGDCHWRIVRICLGGSLEDRAPCPAAPCAASTEVAEVWRALAPTRPAIGDPAWEYRGLMCLTEPPAPADAIHDSVLEHTRRMVPALSPASLPAGTTLTNLPTSFRSGQPPFLQTAPALVAGTEVTVSARPTWTWDFGHGAALTTADPGARSSRGSVRHTYPRRGLYRVRVTCVWHAVYSTRGIPDIPVPGEITQSAWFDLRVREARRFLR